MDYLNSFIFGNSFSVVYILYKEKQWSELKKNSFINDLVSDYVNFYKISLTNEELALILNLAEIFVVKRVDKKKVTD